MAWQIETAARMLINGVALLALEAANGRVVLDSMMMGLSMTRASRWQTKRPYTITISGSFAPPESAPLIFLPWDRSCRPIPATLTVTAWPMRANTVKLAAKAFAWVLKNRPRHHGWKNGCRPGFGKFLSGQGDRPVRRVSAGQAGVVFGDILEADASRS